MFYSCSQQFSNNIMNNNYTILAFDSKSDISTGSTGQQSTTIMDNCSDYIYF